MNKQPHEIYQCPGCISGDGCFSPNQQYPLTCKNHVPGTFATPSIGKIMLGLPKGFNRVGPIENFSIHIFNNFEEGDWYSYSDIKSQIKFNVPVWMFLDENGNTIIRGLSPRINSPFLHIFIGDVRSKINCCELTQNDIDLMD